MAAYSSEVRALFSLRPSARCFAPSAPSELRMRLRTRAKSACQRLLTVGKASTRGVLERLERLVLLEALGEVLGGLRIESILLEAANEGGIGASAAD